MDSTRHSPLLAAAAFALLTAALPAAATTQLNLTDSVFNLGTPTTANYQATLSGLAANAPITGDASLGIADGFNGATGSGIANLNTSADFDAIANGSCVANCGGPWNFQDDYLFSTTAAIGQIAAISLGTVTGGLTDLQVRLITSANGVPTVGSPIGGTVINGWTTLNFVGGSYVATMKNPVPAGAYYLQVRGEAVGPSSYGGTVMLTAVPLPGTLPMLVGGLALVAGVIRRRV